MVDLIMQNRGRLLKLYLFLHLDEFTDREEMNVMDHILEVNSSK